MDTINRLQFRHHEEIFETREDALKYICKTLPREGGEGLAEPGSPYTRSLFAEPTILRYKNTEEEDTFNDGCSKGPHIILVIGSQTNYDDRKPEENKYCIIDIDKTEDEIKNLEEELEKAIKSLTIIALNSDTLNLYAEKTEDGTLVSGDVKTAETHVFDGLVKKNNLMIVPTDDPAGPEGLFIYVDLTYDEATETFTFIVTNADGTLKKQSVKFSNNYLVSGEYKKEDESIHLHMKNGDEVIVDCEQLIDEWKVDGEASTTPIVLTREEVGPDEDHHHTEPWQDILRADVRVADFINTNILEKTTDGRYLYVDGKATNILYYYNGEKSNVGEQLDKLNKIKISADNDNIIWNRTDGFFASAKLDYISNKNKLVFTTSTVSGGTITKEIQLNSVELFQNIYYDRNTEELVITYKDNEGNLKVIRIPISDMFDEWDVLNDAHSVKLVKTPHHIAGKDILTADVNISVDEDNILEERGEGNVHALLVRGTAGNIKYKNTTVEGALDDLAAKDTEQDGKIQAIEDEIGDGFGPRETVRDAIDALSADTAASLKGIINNDNSIDVDNTNPVKPIIKVNLSGNEPQNTLRLEGDGLYNFIDLNYDPDTNKLTLTRSDNGSTENVRKELQLNSVSIIDGVEYDQTTETLIIKYHSGSEQKELRIPLGEIFQEWEVYNDPDSAVKLNRQRVIDGKDKLSGEVIISSAHDDNILENEHGALYVSGQQIEYNKNTIAQLTIDLADEIARALAAENLLTTNLNNEVTRAISAETALNNAITTVGTNLQNEVTRATAAETRIETSLNNEIYRAQTKENELNSAITAETLRAQAADNELYHDLSDETAARAAGDAELLLKINQESSRAQVAETTISEALNSEITRSAAKDNDLEAAINAESQRAQTAEAALEDAIETATLTFQDTTSINFNDPQHENNVVKADVKVANAPGNIILIDGQKDGLYASVGLQFDHARNVLNLVINGQLQPDIPLGAGSIIDGAGYDNETKELIIYYHSADQPDVQKEVRIPSSDFYNEWIVQNPSDNSAVELTKRTGIISQGIPQPDELSGRVLISPLSDNILTIDTNGLYVPGSGSTLAECVDKKANKLYELLYGVGSSMQNCGENTSYHPYQGACIISAATSFNEADMMLNDQVCALLNMWVSGLTCTNESEWVQDGSNRKIEVNTRLSHGNMAEMTDDDIYIKDFSGGYVDPTRTEFTDTNALKIVCLDVEPSGTTPTVSSKQNGIYLSNVWDCGLYYDEVADAQAISDAEAAGYITDPYRTDTDASASNYMNNVRQSDVPHN